MRRFFVDAFYWIALLNPRDQWHARVLAFAATLDTYHFYTTDEVLTEFLAFYSTANPTLPMAQPCWPFIAMCSGLYTKATSPWNTWASRLCTACGSERV